MRNKIIMRLSILALILVILIIAGPRTKIDLKLRAISLPEDLDQYLARSESQFSDIVPGTEKVIVWANATRTKTPLSIIYLHGFSASRQETYPLCDELASKLGANLYYVRMSGHGRSGQAMAEVKVNDWLNDVNEAFEIGKRLGDRVIVIGTSTGGTLATWLAQQPNTDSVLAYILISPNFAPKDPNSNILTWPWAKQFTPLILGREFSWTPLNTYQDRYWTHRYPSIALVTMMGLVKYVCESDLEEISKPILVLYSPNDEVVSAQEIERRYSQFGSKFKKLIPIMQAGDPKNHVLAGDILAPNNTMKIEKIILDFISQLR